MYICKKVNVNYLVFVWWNNWNGYFLLERQAVCIMETWFWIVSTYTMTSLAYSCVKKHDTPPTWTQICMGSPAFPSWLGNAWLRMSGRTVTLNKKGAQSYSQAGSAPWKRVRACGHSFGVYAACGACTCAWREDCLLRPLLAGPTGQASSRTWPGSQASLPRLPSAA